MSDELKHKAQEGLGKAKEAFGHATGDDKLRAEGKGEQAEAGIKQVGDKLKDAAQKAKDALS